ncbi:MAG: sensor histidine kinase, partial [Jatrophihabitantaceae bacterium]
RRALGVLRDPAGPAELAPAPGVADLDRLLETIRQTGLEAVLSCTGPVADLPPSLQLSIYRLVQESITNTVKHAVGAGRVSVQLRRTAAAIDVLVTDDGALSRPVEDAGGIVHGILGMRERTSMHGGSIEVGPTPNGWHVHASFPALAADDELPASSDAGSPSRRPRVPK